MFYPVVSVLECLLDFTKVSIYFHGLEGVSILIAHCQCPVFDTILPSPMDSHLLSIACQLYATSPDLLIPLSGGHYNAVYKYPLQKTSQDTTTSVAMDFGVLRIGVQDCPIEQTLGMLEWARFLNEHGAPVTAPLLSTEGHLLESIEFDGTNYTLTAFQNAEGTLAENIPSSEWTDDLFHQNW